MSCPLSGKATGTREKQTIPAWSRSAFVDAARGSDSLRLGELTIASKSRVPRHTHTNTEEAMVLLEGTLEALVGSQRMTIGPGDLVLAPAGTVHGFVNVSDTAARLLFCFPGSRTRPGAVYAAQRPALGIPVRAGPVRLQFSPRPALGARIRGLTGALPLGKVVSETNLPKMRERYG